MADIDAQNPYRQAQFTGIDNRNPETKVRPGYVRDLVNVDPTRDGQMPSRRRGYGAAFYSGAPRSVWGDGVFPWLLFADGGVLYGMQSKADAPIPLFTGLVGDVSYAAVNSDVYFSDGFVSGVVRMNGEGYPWACERPAGQPDLVAA